MNQFQLNITSLPDALKGEDNDHQYTKESVSYRLVSIGELMIKNIETCSQFNTQIIDQLKELVHSVPFGFPLDMFNKIIFEQNKMDNIQNDEELQIWNPIINQLNAQQHSNWLQVPFLFCESLFYFLCCRICNYRLHKSLEYDPFRQQKISQLDSITTDFLNQSIQSIQKYVKNHQQNKNSNLSKEPTIKIIQVMLKQCLWGNSNDLSMWPDLKTSKHIHSEQSNDHHNAKFLLIDHSEKVAEFMYQKTNAKIVLLADNVGIELINDLLLAYFLLNAEIASQIEIIVKASPIFVSDVTLADFYFTLQYIKSLQIDNHDHIGAFMLDIKQFIKNGQLIISDEIYFCSPFPFYEFKGKVVEKLMQCDIIISKGDANYRRLIGDLHWDFFADRFNEIVNYLGTKVVAVRVCKSLAGVGFDKKQITLETEKQDWICSGKYGIIQSNV